MKDPDYIIIGVGSPRSALVEAEAMLRSMDGHPTVLIVDDFDEARKLARAPLKEVIGLLDSPIPVLQIPELGLGRAKRRDRRKKADASTKFSNLVRRQGSIQR